MRSKDIFISASAAVAGFFVQETVFSGINFFSHMGIPDKMPFHLTAVGVGVCFGILTLALLRKHGA